VRHEVFLNTSSGRRSIIIDDDFCHSLSDYSVDNAESIGLFVASWVTLLADSPLDPSNKPSSLYTKFLNRISVQGVKALVLGYADLSHQLVSSHLLMGSSSSTGEWIDGFKDTPVFFEYNRYFKTGDVGLLRYLYTFLNFGKKLDFVDSAFNDAAFRGWTDIENRLNDLKLLDKDVIPLKRILSRVLPTLTLQDFRPKFGPGSVQERGIRGRIDKLRSLRFDPLIDRFLFHGHAGMYGMGEDQGLSASKVIPDPGNWSSAKGVSSRTARLRFVPKNMKTARSICMEPNTLMYFQQGILPQFLRAIDASPLSRFIDIRNQERNKVLACFGSATSEIDTIDLSAASDSVSIQLVKDIFPPSWLIPMLVTRSHSVILPDGSVRLIRKFAPMGSALCFPTQCIIFAAVGVYAACLHVYEADAISSLSFIDWLTPSKIDHVLSLFSEEPGYFRGAFQPMAIYGDDICIDRRLTDFVKSILSRLGFSVNETKSFVGSQAFRESCGGFYMSGHDISPTYFRIKGVRRKLSASHVVSQVHLINECRRLGYYHTYRFLHSSLMTWECHRSLRSKTAVKNSIPYVSDPSSFGIVANEPRNNHLRSRYNTSYQKDEVRAWTISYDFVREPGGLLPLVDAYEHMRWWARGPQTDTTDFMSVSRSDTGGAGLRWRWIPA